MPSRPARPGKFTSPLSSRSHARRERLHCSIWLTASMPSSETQSLSACICLSLLPCVPLKWVEYLIIVCTVFSSMSADMVHSPDGLTLLSSKFSSRPHRCCSLPRLYLPDSPEVLPTSVYPAFLSF